MRSSLKRHLIKLQLPVRSKTLTGSVNTEWVLFKEMWAEVTSLKGYEKQSANAAWPGSDSKISFNYISGILPTMRVLYADRIYSILAINDLEERHRDISLICQSGVKAA